MCRGDKWQLCGAQGSGGGQWQGRLGQFPAKRAGYYLSMHPANGNGSAGEANQAAEGAAAAADVDYADTPTAAAALQGLSNGGGAQALPAVAMLTMEARCATMPVFSLLVC